MADVTYCPTVCERSSAGPSVKVTRSEGLSVRLAPPFRFRPPASAHPTRVLALNDSRFRESLFTLVFQLPPPGAIADGPPRVRRSSSVRRLTPPLVLIVQ